MKITSLIKNLEFNDHKPNVQVLFESGNTKEIRIAMKKGQLMKEHKTPFPIVVEIFEGSIDFGVNKELYHLNKGDIISLDGNVPHDLSSTSDSVIRLSLSKSDHVDRVKSLV
jgi:quercetin dioxygenase-like cupin family protein